MLIDNTTGKALPEKQTRNLLQRKLPWPEPVRLKVEVTRSLTDYSLRDGAGYGKLRGISLRGGDHRFIRKST